jgi:hypothetical protein
LPIGVGTQSSGSLREHFYFDTFFVEDGVLTMVCFAETERGLLVVNQCFCLELCHESG